MNATPARSAADSRSDSGAPRVCEVFVAGGGLVGLSLAIALADAGIRVIVADREDPATAQDAPFDGRSSAIAFGTKRMLETIGLWRYLAEAAQPIEDIRVSDGRPGEPASPLFLHYDHSDVGDEPLGWIVENRAIRQALYRRAAELDRLSLIAPAHVGEVVREVGGVRAEVAEGSPGGLAIRARLVAAADGRFSRLRSEAGIGTTEWAYPQSGIVATVHHQLPHEAVAHEHFLPSGPFALLPMVDGRNGEFRSSLVWTERREKTDGYMAMDDADFSAEMQRRFGDSLGRLQVAGRRWCYPLGMINAERYIARRMALVGDAAHGIHPIAGQGLNLGLRDVAALAEAVVDARRLGLDVGGDDVLARYEGWRRFDAITLITVTDSLNRLFSNDIAPLRLARDVGLATVNRITPVKQFLMHHAMGVVGDLPRLVRGEPL